MPVNLSSSSQSKTVHSTLYFALFFNLLACGHKAQITQSDAKGFLASCSAIQFTIIPLDLTEDLNQLSTHNDEINVIFFFFKSDSLISKPLVYSAILLDGDTFSFNVEQKLFMQMDTAYCFVIEQDDDRNPQEIAKALGQGTKQIYQHYVQNTEGYFTRILNDNDLLYATHYDKANLMRTENFGGTHLFDNYSYVITKKCLTSDFKR